MLLLLASDAFAAMTEGGSFIPHETTLFDRLMSFLGLFVFCGIGWVMSERRKDIQWRPVAWGIGLQLVFGLIVLSPWLQGLFIAANDAVNRMLDFSNAGATFVFQSIEPHTIAVPLKDGGTEMKQFVGQVSPPTKTFAFWILPTIIFFSALMNVLYHIGFMQLVVKAMSRVMMMTMGTSGAETVSMAGNIFLGQTESPLLVKPFLASMTRSELMSVMIGGFCTVSGGVMGAYVGFLQRAIPDIAGHLMVASVLAAPAGFALSKLVVPETEKPVTLGNVDIEFPQTSTNVIEAGANGAADGMKLAINVAAMLIAAVAIMAMLDYLIGFLPLVRCEGAWGVGYSCGVGEAHALRMSDVLGWLFAPLAFFMGVPWSEAGVVGQLLGEKLILTEFIAYMHLGEMVTTTGAPVLSERSAVIASYGLCGFANFASIGIQIGGIGGMAPERTGELASLGLKAMFAGAIAGCMTGSIVGMLT